MADPYATSAPDLSARPTGPPDWEAAVIERGGGLLGPDAAVPDAAPLVVPCRGIGTLAPVARVDAPLAVLLWLEHAAAERRAAAANGMLEALRAHRGPVYAIKQGLVGGPPERPGCTAVTVELVAALLDAAAADSVVWEVDPDFGYSVPAEVEGLDRLASRVLMPRLLYADHDRVYEHASLVAAKKRERHAMAGSIAGLDEAIVDASGWPPRPTDRDWRA